METAKDSNGITKKLNLIAGLLVDIKQSLNEKMSVKDKIAYLLKRGITEDEDISAILGITKNHASKEKATLRKETDREDNDG